MCVSICLPALPIPLKVFLTSEGNYISETPFIAIRKLEAPSQCILSTQAPLSTSSLVHRHQSHWGIIRGSRDTCWKLLWCLRQMIEGPLIKYPQVLGKRLGKSPVYYCCSQHFTTQPNHFKLCSGGSFEHFLHPSCSQLFLFSPAYTAAWRLVLSAVSATVQPSKTLG